MSKKTKTEDLADPNELEGLNIEFAEDAEETGVDDVSADDATLDDDQDAPHVLSLLDNEDGVVIDDDVLADDVNMETEMEAEADSDSIPPLEAADEGELEGTELESFEAAEIEDVEVIDAEQIRAVVEASLFATDKPISIALIKQVFKGTQVKSKDVRQALTELQSEYATSARGFTLEEIAGGFQLRTKPELMKYLRQSVKARPFKLSGPALEVLSIVAYKQPTTKSQIDEIRGVESGHLLRALMEKHLLTFGERSDLPGKPMFYETTKKFLEIFSLRNLAELPSLSEIDQLIPEGIGEVEDKETLSDLTGQLSKEAGASYSEGEDELLKITDELTQITTSSDFFEQEKQRERERRDLERARDLREALTVGETIEAKDQRWLERYEQAQLDASAASDEVAFVTGDDAAPAAPTDGEAPEGFGTTSDDDVVAAFDAATDAEEAAADEPAAASEEPAREPDAEA